jgi:SAM-dependent methyltransferase
MLSDGRAVEAPRRLRMCMSCGLARRVGEPLSDAEVYGEAYALNDTPPGAVATDVARHEQYAEWIRTEVERAPTRIFDAGCGNGALLQCLGVVFPGALLQGMEPAPRAVARARSAGLDVVEGYFAPGHAAATPADLVVSVNVIEHVPDPVAFLQAVRESLAVGGRAVVICPDGDSPSVELLFADHLYSYTSHALGQAAQRAGLRVVAAGRAPASLGAFQMVVLEAAASGGDTPADAADVRRLFDERAKYLATWRALGAVLDERLLPYKHVTAFGFGEAADLLRVYAPGAWGRVKQCAVDDPSVLRASEVPVRAYRELTPTTGHAVLLAVRPRSQGYLGERVGRDGFAVVRWDDIVSD